METKNCKRCGMELPPAGYICPYCKKQHRLSDTHKIIGWLLGTLLLLIIIANAVKGR